MKIEGYRRMGGGPKHEVWAKEQILSQIQTAPVKDRARTKEILKELCENGQQRLNPVKFREEGSHLAGQAGQADVKVYAVKSYQLRIYGGFVGSNDKFFVCEVADIKKSQKADQKLLKRVAKALGELNAKLG